MRQKAGQVQRHNILQLIRTSLIRKLQKETAQTSAKPPMLNPQGKYKKGEERNKKGDGTKKGKIWVLPGVTASTSGSHTCGSPS